MEDCKIQKGEEQNVEGFSNDTPFVKTNNMKKIFQIKIANNYYDVWDIYGKKHNGYNNTPTTWWLYFGKNEKEIPNENDENFVPYCCASLNRHLWDIRIKQSNSAKYKWDSYSFNSHTNVEMWCNDKLIYSFGGWKDTQFIFAKIQYLMVLLSEHPFNFFEPEKEEGRKIWWYGLPAKIKINKSEPGNIGIIPDYSTGLDKNGWWEEYKRRSSKYNYVPTEYDLCFEEDFDELKVSDFINWGDALSDGNINWFRK